MSVKDMDNWLREFNSAVEKLKRTLCEQHDTKLSLGEQFSAITEQQHKIAEYIEAIEAKLYTLRVQRNLKEERANPPPAG